MKSLLLSSEEQKKPEVEKIPHRLHLIFQGLTKRSLSTPESASRALESYGLKVKILKRPRQHKPHDAYILGIQIGREAISIKIHLDIFEKCARVYNNSKLLGSLVEDHDLPEILHTTVKSGYRLVFYKWENGVDPLSVIRGLSAQVHRKVEKALTRLLLSLEEKGCQLSSSNARSHEFLYQGEKGKMILLDANKILQRRNPNISTVLQAKRIFQTWVDAIHALPV